MASAPATYNDLTDAVLFGDAPVATGNPIINLASVFSPVSVKPNSSSHDYTMSGPVILDAANTRTLTLATTNTYTGNPTIGGGTLQIGGAGRWATALMPGPSGRQVARR